MSVRNAFSLYKDFDAHVAIDFASSHWEFPATAIAVYLCMVLLGPKFMANREPLPLKPAFKVWNLFLATFSIVGSIYTVPDTWHFASTKGLRWTVSQNPLDGYYHNSPGAFWFFAFGMSKIPELVDTFFLVFQKKPVIFLHWYHHVTVLLYCWHAYCVGVGAGMYFTAMNFVVHSVMYSYYFLMCFPSARKYIRKIAMFITSIQLFQMIGGVAISLMTAYYYNQSAKTGEQCHVDVFNLEMAFAMYTSYFVLFGALFRKLYGPKPKSSARSSVGSFPAEKGKTE